MARRFIASGRVQGVGFRNYVEHMAEKIGVDGFVRNLRDGRVEVLAFGTRTQLKKMQAALEMGPMLSHVAAVTEEPAVVDPRYVGNFVIETTME